MAISDTIFFGGYQATLGTTYARGFQELYNPASTLQQYILARQSFISGMSTSDTANGVSVISAHLSAENSYTTAALQIVKPVLLQLNNFFSSTYGTPTRDYFNSLTQSRLIAWKNSFKEAWFQARTEELVQHIGYATWNGSAFIVYPAYSPITNIQNTSGVSTSLGNQVTLINFNAPLANFALPGDIIVSSLNPTFPTPANISLGTTVVGYANTNILVLNGPIGLATNLFAFRSLKNAEHLEFRFGPAGVTGLAATVVVADLGLTVTLTNGVTTSVTIGAANTIGRVNIGAFNNNIYKATGISNIAVTSGSNTSLGTQQSLEIWVKSTN